MHDVNYLHPTHVWTTTLPQSPFQQTSPTRSFRRPRTPRQGPAHPLLESPPPPPTSRPSPTTPPQFPTLPRVLRLRDPQPPPTSRPSPSRSRSPPPPLLLGPPFHSLPQPSRSFLLRPPAPLSPKLVQPAPSNSSLPPSLTSLSRARPPKPPRHLAHAHKAHQDSMPRQALRQTHLSPSPQHSQKPSGPFPQLPRRLHPELHLPRSIAAKVDSHWLSPWRPTHSRPRMAPPEQELHFPRCIEGLPAAYGSSQTWPFRAPGFGLHFRECTSRSSHWPARGRAPGMRRRAEGGSRWAKGEGGAMAALPWKLEEARGSWPPGNGASVP